MSKTSVGRYTYSLYRKDFTLWPRSDLVHSCKELNIDTKNCTNDDLIYLIGSKIGFPNLTWFEELQKLTKKELIKKIKIDKNKPKNYDKNVLLMKLNEKRYQTNINLLLLSKKDNNHLLSILHNDIFKIIIKDVFNYECFEQFKFFVEMSFVLLEIIPIEINSFPFRLNRFKKNINYIDPCYVITFDGIKFNINAEPDGTNLENNTETLKLIIATFDKFYSHQIISYIDGNNYVF